VNQECSCYVLMLFHYTQDFYMASQIDAYVAATRKQTVAGVTNAKK
jgi:hypothetical protein